MPDAWEILKAASPGIVNDDAWVRLNNLDVGGEVTELVAYDLKEGLEVEIDMHCIEVEVDTHDIEVEIDQGIEVDVETTEIEVEICQ